MKNLLSQKKRAVSTRQKYIVRLFKRYLPLQKYYLKIFVEKFIV